VRIVEVVPSLGVGGAERMAGLLSVALHERGHEVTVVSLFSDSETWIARDLAARGVPVRSCGKRPGLDLAVVPRLRDLLRELGGDTIHTHLHALKYVLASGYWGRTTPVFHTLHNLAEHEIERPSRWLHGAAFRAGVAPVAIGEAVADSVRRVYRQPPRATIPNGIRVAAFRPRAGARERLRAELGLDGATVLLTVGRLDAQKDHAGLLDALAGVPGPVLVVAGDGALRGQLEARAASLGLAGRVRWLGVRDDVPDLLAAADLFVLASRWEGNPLVVMEAMAAGRPLVATAVGCVPELVPPEAGVLVPPGDRRALSQAIETFLADGRVLEDAGRAAAELAARRFDVSVMAAAYEAAFEAPARERR
jgi:glycosyltransferase involved in cell wall biosynthesis